YTAQAIARERTFHPVIADGPPHEKVAAVQQLPLHHGAVAYAVHGTKHPPAGAHADVGMALATGTDVALEAADVVSMSGNLQHVATGIGLSPATMRNTRQNLFWAFIYNIALIPIAAGVLYPFFGILLSPMFAAGAMALSS